MNTTLVMPQQSQNPTTDAAIKSTVNSMIDELITALPDPKKLTAEKRRGIIARYTGVLEGNFIYWMTATLLSVQSQEARPILLDNLNEEIRDAHPAMLRRFAIAAHAFPTDTDSLAVTQDLSNVRVFLGRLSSVQSLATMAFFEGFIQRFMGYFADLATAQGSLDMEYTDVHGVCDIAHTDGLFQALSIEMALNPLEPETDVLEGVYLLRRLLETIIFNRAEPAAA
ncbi:iron-containing redox enzyme family protein [Tunturiibacter lichenicola]|uniref:iron-containing redox enzyme family protein n=1 Tax=Tunturiibacter lichenicola TaxID=2051959 RepID=UPI0021B2374F|nr:iron-containing redox enzyme family protein [Edaphobacter lichenicola]